MEEVLLKQKEYENVLAYMNETFVGNFTKVVSEDDKNYYVYNAARDYTNPVPKTFIRRK